MSLSDKSKKYSNKHTTYKKLTHNFIKVCKVCGKVDAIKGDGHDCETHIINEYNRYEDYK